MNSFNISKVYLEKLFGKALDNLKIQASTNISIKCCKQIIKKIIKNANYKSTIVNKVAEKCISKNILCFMQNGSYIINIRASQYNNLVFVSILMEMKIEFIEGKLSFAQTNKYKFCTVCDNSLKYLQSYQKYF